MLVTVSEPTNSNHSYINSGINMTSSNIYTSEKALPYVYRLDNPTTGEIYIGYREANKRPSHLDLPEYRTSSEYVEPRFDEFNWTIVAEFFLGNDAYDHEQFSIFEEWENPLLMNGNCFYGKKRWKTGICSEETKSKMSNTRKGVPKSEETKARISAGSKGKIKTAEHLAKIGAGNKGKTISAEQREKLSIAGKGKKHSEETKAKIGASGKGKVMSDESKLKMSAAHLKQVECPHCGKIGGRIMYRWHFDNCKQLL